MTINGQVRPKRQPGAIRAVFLSECPRCGATGLFAGPAAFTPRCRGCALDCAAGELSPRALYPVVLPVIVAMILIALRIDDAWHPPLWTYVVMAPPLVAGVMIGTLRLAKVLWLMRSVHRGQA